MATEYLSLSSGGLAGFRWPDHCAACSRNAVASLTSSFSATSNTKYLVAYASWNETSVAVRFPVCRLHWAVFILPMKLTGMSLWHKVAITIAALAFTGGAIGVATRIGSPTPWTASSTITTAFLLLPAVIWWLARHFAPVRVSDFAPPKLWLRIRDSSFANEFQRANPTATEARK